MKRFTAILAALLAASCVFSSAVMAIPGETDPQTGYNQYVQDNIRYDALGYAYIDDEDGTRIYSARADKYGKRTDFRYW